MSRKITRKKFGQVRESKWSSRELIDFAKAMQRYGSSDVKNIAEAIGTKTQNDVKNFIHVKIMSARRRFAKSLPFCSSNPRRAKFLSLKFKKFISKWRKLVHNVIDPPFRSQDYSTRVMSNLIQSFFEDEKEPSNRQVVNTKEIYRYILNCFKGGIPTQLPPMESYVVMKLFEELREITTQATFSEEQDWLRAYDNKIVFVPTDFVMEPPVTTLPSGVQKHTRFRGKPIRVPDSFLTLIQEHKKLLQSFNPLVVPVWFLAKEREVLANKLKSG
ncbi:uncharacterized protein LOC129225759 [Uloborus diversus]|uniref:uncharacterized protein LOC129225759 n=1 Tax=Uloborus diversus TaxID=327109 RepID=UPI00240A1116|nr:uncharacterized protein LOC129225759 [Uloborus diversus]